jgi:hypothetical protein
LVKHNWSVFDTLFGKTLTLFGKTQPKRCRHRRCRLRFITSFVGLFWSGGNFDSGFVKTNFVSFILWGSPKFSLFCMQFQIRGLDFVLLSPFCGPCGLAFVFCENKFCISRLVRLFVFCLVKHITLFGKAQLKRFWHFVW